MQAVSKKEKVMTYGSLFSGIGGIDLGLDRAGMKCIWQCENDPYACRVLEKHWPGVKRYGDITQVNWEEAERPDLICGGFPCQDISFAGKGAGLSGARSGLFYEAIRAVRILRPRYVLLENVAALLVRGLDAVLGTLAEVGYDAEWKSIQADYIGSPQKRERVFVVAYSECDGRVEIFKIFNRLAEEVSQKNWTTCSHLHTGNGVSGRVRLLPDFGVHRVDHGIPSEVDRLRCLGNAVVPQIPELIGKAIMETEFG